MAALGGAVGFGFVLGPGFGGVLSKKKGLHVPPLLAAALFCAAQASTAPPPAQVARSVPSPSSRSFLFLPIPSYSFPSPPIPSDSFLFLPQLVVGLFLPETAALPLAVAELTKLLAEAKRRWASVGHPASATPPAAVLGIDAAHGLCAPLVRAFGAAADPAGGPLPDAEVTELVEHLQAALAGVTKGGAADETSGGRVTWEAFADVLASEYAEYKVSRGMLHAGARANLLRAVGRRPVAADGSGGNGGGGDGGGGGGLFEGLSEVALAARRVWGSGSSGVRGLLVARTLVELATIMTHAVFADYTRAKFGWDQKYAALGARASRAHEQGAAVLPTARPPSSSAPASRCRAHAQVYWLRDGLRGLALGDRRPRHPPQPPPLLPSVRAGCWYRTLVEPG